MHRQFIIKLLEKYQTLDQQEKQMQRDLVQFVKQYNNCFDRELSVGHITGSAWLVNKELSHVFFTHHKKLNQWFQPGGHSDGNANTLSVAMQEASEESGIEDVYIQALNNNIFDIDIHTIPARKKEPEHLHYDIRFILEADMNQPLKISDESNEIAWIAIEEIPKYTTETSIMRMLDKMKKLKNSN
jgi:8-oxo-dGTP pyrophosphatase MutT (NUDIX family)